MRVLVLGGTGFVGQSIVRKLSTNGHQVTILSRRPERHRHLLLVPNVVLLPEKKLTDLQLRKYISGQDAVVNLIGILHPQGRNTFHHVHVGLARKISAACQVEGVHRLLQMSALGVSHDAPSAYLRSKAEAETIINGHGLKTTIFRPSVIFGEGDHFINQFHSMMKMMPVMGVVCPQAQLSPVWVEDVAKAFADALDNPHTIGKVYELCGGRTYQMMELMQVIAELTMTHTKLLPLSDRLSRFMARVLEILPGNLFTRDNYASLQVPSVCHQIPQEIEWKPRSLRNYLTQVLGEQRIRDRYMEIRKQAGRNVHDRG